MGILSISGLDKYSGCKVYHAGLAEHLPANRQRFSKSP
jgi:hypothetical protein